MFEYGILSAVIAMALVAAVMPFFLPFLKKSLSDARNCEIIRVVNSIMSSI